MSFSLVDHKLFISVVESQLESELNKDRNYDSKVMDKLHFQRDLSRARLKDHIKHLEMWVDDRPSGTILDYVFPEVASNPTRYQELTSVLEMDQRSPEEVCRRLREALMVLTLAAEESLAEK